MHIVNKNNDKRSTQCKIPTLYHKNLQNCKKSMQQEIPKRLNRNGEEESKATKLIARKREKTEETDRQYLILVINNKNS